MVTLPPLAALRAFEATVRLGGLARAAVDLASPPTQSAIRVTPARDNCPPPAASCRCWRTSGLAPGRSDLHGRVLEELGLPREISVAPGTETTDREVPADAHAPVRRDVLFRRVRDR